MILHDLRSQYPSHDAFALSFVKRAWANRSSVLIPALAILALVVFDQLTKFGAQEFTPAAHRLMASPERMFGLGWHLHRPDSFSDFTALGAFALVAVLCALPVPGMIKVLWSAAAGSNHVEMLLRPGTMDFLAFRLFGKVFVANVADVYFAIGVLALLIWTVQRIRSCGSLYERV